MKKKFIPVLMLLVMVMSLFPGTVSAETKISVSSADELTAVIADLNTNGGSSVIVLEKDITLTKDASLSKGTLTILGNGHYIDGSFGISGDATMNLGSSSSSSTLRMKSTNPLNCVFGLSGSATLNIYSGTTIGPSEGRGQAGGIQANDTSRINMYGGVIEDCNNFYSVSGAVYICENARFEMKNGTIKNCSGVLGAIGIDGAAPIGSDDPSLTQATFKMDNGSIQNCNSTYLGGGAVCIYTSKPVSFIMNGGTISGCNITTASGQGSGAEYGGAVFMYSSDPNTKVELNGGTITNNKAKFGGGVFAYQGNMTISDNMKIYGNTATTSGDDIYNNGANVNLGKAPTDKTLSCGHNITGWYQDESPRWNYSKCADANTENHVTPFTDTNKTVTTPFAVKAAHGTIEYKVSFDINTNEQVAAPDEQTVELNEMAEAPTPPDTQDWIFLGWYLPDGTPYDFDTPVTSDITLIAKWAEDINNNDKPDEEEEKYTVTYTDGIEGETVFEDQITDGLLSGLATPEFNGTPEKDGYTFVGWDPEVSEKVTKNVTYTAKWIKVDQDITGKPALDPDDDTDYGKIDEIKDTPAEDPSGTPSTGDNSQELMPFLILLMFGSLILLYTMSKGFLKKE